jgi:ABC-type sugar transport system permease subunit
MMSRKRVPRENLPTTRNRNILPYLLIAPCIAVLISLSLYPLLFSVKVAFQIGSGEEARWSLANFSRLLSDTFFRAALSHTIIYAASALTLEFLFGL